MMDQLVNKKVLKNRTSFKRGSRGQIGALGDVLQIISFITKAFDSFIQPPMLPFAGFVRHIKLNKKP